MGHFKHAILFFGLFIAANISAQDLPLGYIKHYTNNFSDKTIGEEISNTARSQTSIKGDGKNLYLELTNTDSDSTLFPSGMLIFSDQIYGEYILEASVNYTCFIQDSTSGFYFLGSIRDSSNYYCIGINNLGSRFFRIYNGEKVSLPIEGHLTLEPGKWHKIRITRDILNRNFTIQKGKEKIIINDPNLVMGYIGFGSQQGKISIDDLVIWAPTSIKKSTSLFHTEED